MRFSIILGVLIGLSTAVRPPLAQESRSDISPQSGTPAQSPRAINLSEAQAIALAKDLILAGRLAQARKVLTAMEGSVANATEVSFLLAEIEVREGNYGAAIRRYRKILDKEPRLSRVRLELARAYFLEKDDEKAVHHFRLVLASNPPEVVVKNIERFLMLIGQRKRWKINTVFAVAPDSNINVAPDDNRVILFGLPFDLSQDAQETSGVGIIGSLGAEYAYPINESWLFDTMASVWRAEYEGGTFDDTIVSGAAGPRYVRKKWTASAKATANRRWFGKGGLSWSVGFRAEAAFMLSPRFRLAGALARDWIDYDVDNLRDGTVTWGLIDLLYGLTSVSTARLQLGYARESTQSEALNNNTWRIGLGYRRDLGSGISVQLSPEFSYRDFDAEQIAFGKIRQDIQAAIGVEFITRRWSVFGFAPVFGYQFTYNDSNISFHDYTRHRGTIGVTREF